MNFLFEINILVYLNSFGGESSVFCFDLFYGFVHLSLFFRLAVFFCIEDNLFLSFNL